MNFEIVETELKNSQVKTNKYVGLSANTIKSYIAKLRYLEKQSVLNDQLSDFLNTTYEKVNSRAAYQTAILGVAKHSPTFTDYIGKGIIDIITNEYLQTSKDVKHNQSGQSKTEKEEENWIDLKELKKLAKEKASEFSVQDQLLIGFYTLIPPVRLDLHNILIVRSSFINEETGKPENIGNQQNYLRIYKKSGKFYTELVLNEYKTSATYGEFKEKMPKPLTDLIMKLPVEQSHLFQKKSGGNFSSAETFGVYLRSVFNKLTGKNLSVDMLRHIYLTDFRKGEKSTERKQAVARKMMNSVEQQTEYLRLN
jgi:hypothetical protein